ncbi:hypothetical protein PSAC2689_190049 [Paraburkholderia sacchari]
MRVGDAIESERAVDCGLERARGEAFGNEARLAFGSVARAPSAAIEQANAEFLLKLLKVLGDMLQISDARMSGTGYGACVQGGMGRARAALHARLWGDVPDARDAGGQGMRIRFPAA